MGASPVDAWQRSPHLWHISCAHNIRTPSKDCFLLGSRHKRNATAYTQCNKPSTRALQSRQSSPHEKAQSLPTREETQWPHTGISLCRPAINVTPCLEGRKPICAAPRNLQPICNLQVSTQAPHDVRSPLEARMQRFVIHNESWQAAREQPKHISEQGPTPRLFLLAFDHCSL